MKLTMAMTLAVTGVAGVAVPAAAQGSDAAPVSLAVTPNQTAVTKGGYVIDVEGSKTFVTAACKATLVDAGVVATVRPWSELAAVPTLPRAQRSDCDTMVGWFDDLATEADDELPATPATGGGGSDEPDGSFHALWYRTAGTTDPTKGGFIVTHGQFRTRVTPECKAELLDAGMLAVDSTWSNVRQLEEKANSCDDLMEILTNGGDHGTPGGHDEHSDPTGDAPAVGGAGDAGHSGHVSVPGAWVKASDEQAVYADRQVPETYHLFDPADHPHRTWGTSRIGFLVQCESVGFQQVDPIVSPGQPSHHEHEFFGNPNITSTSTTQSLADTPMRDIECSDVNDKSAYWSPAVYQDGKRAAATDFKAYYKSTTANTVPMPFGLRMIAGDASADGDQGGKVGWFEVQRTNDLTPVSQLTKTRGATEMITRPNDDTNIVLRMNFPNCWDGVHLDSPDHQSHVAYFNERTKACPSTHPVKIPQLVTFARYDVDGGDGFELASGPWHTYHQDFWNAWSPAQMEALNEECIIEQMNCRVRRSPALMRLGQFEQVIPG
ncbi:MAG: DUF1996 domain-containing protein [Ilumatobacter sp.]